MVDCQIISKKERLLEIIKNNPGLFKFQIAKKFGAKKSRKIASQIGYMMTHGEIVQEGGVYFVPDAANLKAES